jgi:DNA gyrase/topoisomerase IV subunit B
MPPETTPSPNYSGRSIKVLTWDEAVRSRPKMYFGADREDPALLIGLIRAVASEPFDCPGNEPVNVEIVIEADLTFAVADNMPLAYPNPGGLPDLRPADSLLGRRRWALRAVAALTTSTTVEMRTAGRIWRQELAGSRAIAGPRDGGASDRQGIRVTFDLDHGYFPHGAALPRGKAELLWATPMEPGSGSLTLIDSRTSG